jgi:hypothetical protein
MPDHEIDAVLLRIRTVVLELRRLEGDGLDGLVLSSRRQEQELESLKSRLAEIVSHDPSLAAA